MLPIILTGPNASVYSYTLIDSGGSAISSIGIKFVIACYFSLKELEEPLTLYVVDRIAYILYYIIYNDFSLF